MTGLDLITDALIEIGVVAADESPTASDAALALRHLNRLLDSSNIDRSKINKISIDEYTLTPGLQPHTIGIDPDGLLTADLQYARPAKIIRAYIKTGSGTSVDHQEIAVWTEQEWSAIRARGMTGDIPEGVYPDYNVPLCSLYFWPVPSAANVYEQHSWVQFTEIDDLTETLVFPSGYPDALMYELAVRLCSPFGREVKQSTATMAARALAALQTINGPSLLMECDPAIVGRGRSYNIQTDE